MSHVVVIGCGVVGAAIAYELSQVPGLRISVLDKQQPATAATGAALGVLMGVISHKIKGKAWQMREASIQRYETLIPELEAITKHQIPFNRQGILMLCFAQEDLARWESLVKVRTSDGWQLEIWDAAKVKSRCPQINCDAEGGTLGDNRLSAAVYSPQDRQVDPVSLTLALVEAAKRNGVTFHFGVTVEEYDLSTTTQHQPRVRQIKTKAVGVEESPLIQDVDWLIVSAGLGSLESLHPLAGKAGLGEKIISESPSLLVPPSFHPSSRQNSTQFELGRMVDIRAVLGQAIQVKLKHPLGNLDFQPVITGNDVHIVPCDGGAQATEYWVGATVEFPTDKGEIVAEAARLDEVMQQAIAFCPALADSTIVRTWSGLRPRPEGRPAPVIGHLPGFSNILLATGHYRNGVLLAPATAGAIRQMILDFRF